jgi:hypothetical protein
MEQRGRNPWQTWSLQFRVGLLTSAKVGVIATNEVPLPLGLVCRRGRHDGSFDLTSRVYGAITRRS